MADIENPNPDGDGDGVVAATAEPGDEDGCWTVVFCACVTCMILVFGGVAPLLQYVYEPHRDAMLLAIALVVFIGSSCTCCALVRTCIYGNTSGERQDELPP
ncbi:hypothetical protein ACP70R_036042 [Stipagrostis hirtigluma subsp. patula]